MKNDALGSKASHLKDMQSFQEMPIHILNCLYKQFSPNTACPLKWEELSRLGCISEFLQRQPADPW